MKEKFPETLDKIIYWWLMLCLIQFDSVSDFLQKIKAFLVVYYMPGNGIISPLLSPISLYNL